MVGLGLMGGSLAMALRSRCREIIGTDPDEHALAEAVRRGIIDRACPSTGPLPQVDLIVLAAPVRAILLELERLPSRHPAAAVVMDLGSTKKSVTEAMAALPEQYDPIGGHPMCGKETGGLENADPAMFTGAPFALVRLERTRPAGSALALAVIRAVGARLVEIDAETHDRWTAATSHTPFLLANALAAVTPKDARPLIGSGLRSTTRLAPSSPEMMIDILATNRSQVRASLGLVRSRLEAIDAALESGDEVGLRALMAEGAANYTRYIRQ